MVMDVIFQGYKVKADDGWFTELGKEKQDTEQVIRPARETETERGSSCSADTANNAVHSTARMPPVVSVGVHRPAQEGMKETERSDQIGSQPALDPTTNVPMAACRAGATPDARGGVAAGTTLVAKWGPLAS